MNPCITSGLILLHALVSPQPHARVPLGTRGYQPHTLPREYARLDANQTHAAKAPSSIQQCNQGQHSAFDVSHRHLAQFACQRQVGWVEAFSEVAAVRVHEHEAKDGWHPTGQHRVHSHMATAAPPGYRVSAGKAPAHNLHLVSRGGPGTEDGMMHVGIAEYWLHALIASAAACPTSRTSCGETPWGPGSTM